ncbi:C-type lectin domain family 2 member L isoform X3 [Chelonia mydas]|uniref:C-type lectin domain family 2 member L isoform X3 n=1 Tax=Chelonia mydas TaxID=8469 RepID=UPI0018A22130|nr:C-type lectin domain family 2 member L isoform X3 [Chelonia mydas]
MEPVGAQREGEGGIPPRATSGAAGALPGGREEREPLTNTAAPGTPEDRSSQGTEWAPGAGSEPQPRSGSGEPSPRCTPAIGSPSLPTNATFWTWKLSECGEQFSRMKEAVSGFFSSQKLVVGTVAIGILVLVLVIFLKPPISLPSEPCPEDWLYFKRKCYYLSEEEKDWDSSQSFCSLYEASLAVIENHQEMHFLTKRMHMQDSWIGLRKREEGFYWVNGTPLTTDLYHEPNSTSSTATLLSYVLSPFSRITRAGAIAMEPTQISTAVLTIVNTSRIIQQYVQYLQNRARERQ